MNHPTHPALYLAAQVRAARHTRGLTQVQLADLAGVSLPTVVRIESAKRTPNFLTISRVASALGCRLELVE